jgi:hypothetical protein
MAVTRCCQLPWAAVARLLLGALCCAVSQLPGTEAGCSLPIERARVSCDDLLTCGALCNHRGECELTERNGHVVEIVGELLLFNNHHVQELDCRYLTRLDSRPAHPSGRTVALHAGIKVQGNPALHTMDFSHLKELATLDGTLPTRLADFPGSLILLNNPRLTRVTTFLDAEPKQLVVHSNGFNFTLASCGACTAVCACVRACVRACVCICGGGKQPTAV